ncbi:MarR family winged helix-turn-helix transcriptional regulator [Sagittula sp. S175]|uniref:MarR family winged helix-turn-helix transcriptional regulator n=1 Tax=Sagittula sp. S175 TaxID=3415129 RepID=UPI003C7C3B9D
MTDLQQMPGHVIRRLHQQSTQLFQTRMKAAGHDLTPVQFAAMGAIRKDPGIDQASVAANIANDRATIGGVIDRLVQKGWVARSVSQRDRRARELSLTAEGEAIFLQVLPLVAGFQSDILAGLDEAERATFLSLAARAIAGSDDA